jgi:hypothetical protein
MNIRQFYTVNGNMATYNELINHSQHNLIFFRDLVYFTTYFSQAGHLEVIYTMYKIHGRKITA